MTDEEILKKAIEKAVGNGWGTFKEVKDLGLAIIRFPDKDTIVMNWEDTGYSYHTCSIIFSHDFAKAFWGNGKWKYELCGKEYEDEEDIHKNECKDWDCRNRKWVIDWECGLTQMVLEKDPIQYLEQFL